MATRNRGVNFSGSQTKRYQDEFIEKVFSDPNLQFTAKKNMTTIRLLDRIVSEIETEVMSQVKLKKEFKQLLTTPGIGNILGLTIMLEVGDIRRFAKVGNYSSYCRCVESKKTSNGKKKGENNKKNGNRYLAWAYVEGANHAIRCCPKAEKFFQRKLAKNKRVLAIKALANKLSKATYYVMRDQIAFDEDKLFH